MLYRKKWATHTTRILRKGQRVRAPPPPYGCQIASALGRLCFVMTWNVKALLRRHGSIEICSQSDDVVCLSGLRSLKLDLPPTRQEDRSPNFFANLQLPPGLVEILCGIQESVFEVVVEICYHRQVKSGG